MAPGRYVTTESRRLTIEKTTAHIRIRLHHLGCPAQLTEEKDAAFKRLGLAAEAGACTSGAAYLLRQRAVNSPIRRRGGIRR
ncbi:DUF6420 family protein [Streptomyces antimycoticus]